MAEQSENPPLSDTSSPVEVADDAFSPNSEASSESEDSSLSTASTRVGDNDENISSTSIVPPQADERTIQESAKPEVLVIGEPQSPQSSTTSSSKSLPQADEETIPDLAKAEALVIEEKPQSLQSSTTSSPKYLPGENDGDYSPIAESSGQAGEDKTSIALEQGNIAEAGLEPKEPQYAEKEVPLQGSFLTLTEQEDGNQDFKARDDELESLIDPRLKNLAEPAPGNEDLKRKPEIDSTSLAKKEPASKKVFSQVQQWFDYTLKSANSLPQLKEFSSKPRVREVQIVCRDHLKVLRIPVLVILAILGSISSFILCFGLKIPGIPEYDASYPFESSFLMCTLETLSAIYVCLSVKWYFQDPRATWLDMVAILSLFTLLVIGFYNTTLSRFFSDEPEYLVGVVTLNVAVLVISFLWNVLSIRKHLGNVYRIVHLGLKRALKKAASSLHRKNSVAQNYSESKNRAAFLMMNAPHVVQSSNSIWVRENSALENMIVKGLDGPASPTAKAPKALPAGNFLDGRWQ